MRDHEDRLRIIRGLLAQAEGTTSPDEAKAFSAKAEELMTRWAIEEADARGAAAAFQNEIGQSRITIEANEYRGPKIDLLMAVAAANHVRLLLGHPRRVCKVCGERLFGSNARTARHPLGEYDHEPKSERVVDLTMFGFATDREFVEMLFTSLLVQREHEFLSAGVQQTMWHEFERYDGRPNAKGGWRIKWFNTFGSGYADAISQKLWEAKRAISAAVATEAGRTSESVALALTDRTKAVDAAFKEAFPRLGKGKASSAGQGSGAAYGAGHSAGLHANVSRPTTRRALGD